MKLSDVPFDQIKVGLKVSSAIGVAGEVVWLERNPKYIDLGIDCEEVTIKWVNGQTTVGTMGWMLEEIEVVDEQI